MEEGAQKAVTNKYLDISADDIGSFIYNVTRGPAHGRLDVLAPNRVDVVRPNATYFTSEELSADLLVYAHDDSESRRDAFHFFAVSSSSSR